MPLRAGILTFALLLLAAAPARAAFDVTAFELTPSSTAAGAHADVTIATSFTPNEQPRTVIFHLPAGLAGDPFATSRCSEADYRADNCAAASKVGTVEARAVIGLVPVPQTATGELYNLVPAGPEPARLGAVVSTTLGKLFIPTTINARSSDGGLDSVGIGAIPGLTIQLADPIPLRLDGTAALTPQGLKTTFTGLPDVPLAAFRLDLAGGAGGAFVLGSDLCAAKPPTVGAAFTAHSGAQFSESRPLSVLGCTPAPKLAVKITRLRTDKPTVRLSVKAARGAPALRAARLLLPSKLTAKPKRARRGAHAQAGKIKLPRKAIRLTRDGELRIALPEGARTLRATLSKGAVRAGRKLRRKREPKRQSLRVLVRDADGARPAVTLKVRPRRR